MRRPTKRRGMAGRNRKGSYRGRRRRVTKRRINPAKRIAKRRNKLVGDRM